MSDSRLRQMVNGVIDDILESGQRVAKSWAIQAIRMKVDRPSGEDAWYWSHLEGVGLDKEVGKALRERHLAETKPDVPEQMVLPGYERLQKSYSCLDDAGEQVFVPIDQMTPAEVASKTSEFDRNIVGLSTHRREFVRYHELRLSSGSTVSLAAARQ